MKIIIIISAPNSICRTLPASEYKLHSMITMARIDDKRQITITNIVNSSTWDGKYDTLISELRSMIKTSIPMSFLNSPRAD